MKSLHLLNCYLNLSEVFIWYYLKGLRNFEPLILAAEWNNPDAFPLKNGEMLSSRPVKSRFASFLARLRGRFAPFDYSPCNQELEKYSIDIVHAHYGYRAVVAMEFMEKLRLPFITTFYGYDLSQKKYLKRAMEGYKKLFLKGDAFLIEGPAMREKLCRMGCPWNEIHIQRIAICPQRYAYKHRSWDGNRPVKFLFIGRLTEKKGLLTALQALQKIKGSFEWDFTIIGDGPQRKKVEAFIRENSLQEQVEMVGSVSSDALPDYLSSHDVMIQPSRAASDGDSEGGAPTVLLEAQASGMPIVSTMHDDIPNIVKEGENALLSEERDEEDLYRNIVKMVENHKEWPRMADIGFAHIKEKHDVSKEVLELEKKYFSLLS
jgi:colanic acid/amylovoran biosynthesis glycosyltransferase